MYKLYYIRGINRLDTPYFSSIEEQYKYFESNIVKEIDAYYPPHYTDIIEFADEDLDLTTKANYLSIEYKDKIYYYFIDNVEYTNQGLLRISITMDTIQTYMFNIEFIHSDIERRLINRWNKDNINRNYLRENLSNGIMMNKIHYQLEEPYSVGLLLVKMASTYTFSWKEFGTGKNMSYTSTGNSIFDISNLNNNANIINDNAQYILIPYVRDKGYKIIAKWITSGDNPHEEQQTLMGIEATKNTGDPLSAYIRLSENPYVMNIQYIPYNIFENIDVKLDASNKTITIDLGDYGKGSFSLVRLAYYELEEDEQSEAWKSYFDYAIRIDNFKLKDFRDYISFEFEKSLSSKNKFNYKYIPQLIDENYITLKYGEELGWTGYPISKLTTTSIYCSRTINPIDNTRIFKCGDFIVGSNIYHTQIFNNTMESYGLYNDAWKNYLSQNTSTLTRGIALARQQTVYNVINRNINKDMSILDRVKTGLDLIEQNYSISQQLKINKENLEFTPDTEKMGNKMTSDIIGKTLMPFYQIEYCNDIDRVAEQYEGYGYSVNEHYTRENLFNVLNTRYYYNIIKCENIEVNLNILSDSNTLNKIHNRFINGLRLWNVNNLDDIDIGDLYVYDNVEKDVL